MRVNFFLLTVAFASLCTVAVGCGRFTKSPSARTYQIPWPAADGTYKLQHVQLHSFSDPTRLRGSLARILVEPFLGVGGVEGDNPIGRFIETSGGIFVPADMITLQGTTVYAHQERLHDLDESVGVATLNSIWPATIGIEVNIADPKNKQNNAIYDGHLNALLIVPYSFNTALPITMNAGVLAHEHFHSIFQSLVLSKLPRPQEAKPGIDNPEAKLALQYCGVAAVEDEDHETKRPKRDRDGRDGKVDRPLEAAEYNLVLLRGLNEGLADYWAWLYTGDANFISHSLRSEDRRRTLDEKPAILPSREIVKHTISSRCLSFDCRVTYAYELGTSYARFLRQLAIAQADGRQDKEARLAIARAIVTSLPLMIEKMEKVYQSEFVETDILMQPLFSQLGKLTEQSCRLYDDFVPTFELTETSTGYVNPRRPSGCEAWPLRTGKRSE